MLSYRLSRQTVSGTHAQVFQHLLCSPRQCDEGGSTRAARPDPRSTLRKGLPSQEQSEGSNQDGLTVQL